MKQILKTTEDIGQLIRTLRKQQNLTQQQLAQLSNVGTRFLSDIENGKQTCEIGKVLKIFSNLGINIDATYD